MNKAFPAIHAALFTGPPRSKPIIAPSITARITTFVLFSDIFVTQFRREVLIHPKGPPNIKAIRMPVSPIVSRGRIIRGTELAAAPFILTVFFILLVIHPAKKPVTTAPRNPAFVLVASTPPTKPAASAGFPAI